jgi:hypothetical protein
MSALVVDRFWSMQGSKNVKGCRSAFIGKAFECI